VISPRALSAGLLGLAIVAGTAADRPTTRPPLTLGGYRVIAADFHIHSSMWSDGTLTPWGLVLEAERQGLDAIGITGHNQVWDGQAARWFSRLVGGPTVLAGQEIHAWGHHVIAVGIERVVDFRASVADQIDDVHRQGGVAIAAHPERDFWPGFDAAAMARLDGAEICHPLIYQRADGQRELEEFAARVPLTAIGSSDFHGTGRMGLCRTYVFARDNSADAILDALRAHQTVVYGLNGKAYGDPALILLAEAHPELREIATTDAAPGWLDWISRVCGLAGCVGLVLARAGAAGASRSPALSGHDNIPA
jgi:predicted metal-dependent phosphoesterase TrpH